MRVTSTAAKLARKQVWLMLHYFKLCCSPVYRMLFLWLHVGMMIATISEKKKKKLVQHTCKCLCCYECFENIIEQTHKSSAFCSESVFIHKSNIYG